MFLLMRTMDEVGESCLYRSTVSRWFINFRTDRWEEVNLHRGDASFPRGRHFQALWYSICADTLQCKRRLSHSMNWWFAGWRIYVPLIRQWPVVHLLMHRHKAGDPFVNHRLVKPNSDEMIPPRRPVESKKTLALPWATMLCSVSISTFAVMSWQKQSNMISGCNLVSQSEFLLYEEQKPVCLPLRPG